MLRLQSVARQHVQGFWARLRTGLGPLWRSAPGRWARRVVIAALAFQLVYVLAANGLLFSGAVRGWVNGSPQSQYLTCQRAWSPYPGRIYVRDLNLRVQDYNVQFLLHVDRAVVDLDLLSLARRTLHARHLRVFGLVMHFRHKVQSASGSEKRLSAYPPIEGFSDPPLYQGPESPPISDQDYNLWTVHLEDVLAQVRELWFLEYRFLGQAEVKGAFRLRPARNLWVGPASLEFQSGQLSQGPTQLVAAPFVGRIDALVDLFDVREASGMQVFRPITTTIALQAVLADARFLEAYLPKGAWISEGAGTLQLRTTLERGRWAPTSSVHYHTAQLRAGWKQAEISTPLDLTWSVPAPEDPAQPSVPQVRLLANPLRVLGENGKAAALLQDLVLEAHLTNVDATQAPDVRRAQLRVESFSLERVQDLMQLWKPEGFSLQGGPVRGLLQAQFIPGTGLSGKLQSTLNDLTFQKDKLQVTSSADLRLSFESPGLVPEGGTVRDFSLQLRQAALRNQGEELSGWWMSLQTPLIRFDGLPPKTLETTISAKCKDAEPFLSLLGASGAIPKVVGSLVTLPNLQLVTQVQRGAGRTDIVLKQAESESIAVAGRWCQQQSSSRGVFWAGGALLSVGLDVSDEHVSVTPFPNRKWLVERLSDPETGKLQPAKEFCVAKQ